MLDLEYRYEFPTWVMFDYMGIEAHLKKMAMKGWELESVDGLLWRYKKSTPSNKTYKMIFSKSNSDLEPRLTGPQTFLGQQLKEEGWTEIGQLRKARLFVNENENPSDPDTDEMAKYNSIWTATRGSYIMSWLLVLFLGLNLSIREYVTSYQESQNYYEGLWIVAFTGFLALSAFIMLLSYGIWSVKSKSNINRGGKCADTRIMTTLNRVLLVGVFLLLIAYLYVKSSMGTFTMFQGIIYIVIFFIIIGIIISFSKALKNKGVSKKKNIAATSVLTIVLLIISIVIMVIMVMLMMIW